VAAFGWFVFSSGGAVACFLCAALWVALSRGHVASRVALLLVALFYTVASLASVPAAVKRDLTEGYAPFTHDDLPQSGRTAVVLLGSSVYRYRDWDDGQVVSVDSIGHSRVLEAARAFRLANADYIISSGGLLEPRDRNVASGSAMADLLVRLGVPRARVRVEDESGTTHDEAQIVSRMLAAQPVDHVILVTSAVHMRRSVGTFRAAGVRVIPAPAREPPLVDEWWENLVPTERGLSEAGMVAHELAGILIYQWRGWYSEPQRSVVRPKD